MRRQACGCCWLCYIYSAVPFNPAWPPESVCTGLSTADTQRAVWEEEEEEEQVGWISPLRSPQLLDWNVCSCASAVRSMLFSFRTHRPIIASHLDTENTVKHLSSVFSIRDTLSAYFIWFHMILVWVITGQGCLLVVREIPFHYENLNNKNIFLLLDNCIIMFYHIKSSILKLHMVHWDIGLYDYFLKSVDRHSGIMILLWTHFFI